MFSMKKDLNWFVNNLKNELGSRLTSVFIYGSCAGCGQPLVNVDMMVIVDELCAEDICKCSRYVNQWVKNPNPVPVFMDKDEWFSSADVYPMEYIDIKESHKIVYGLDLISQVEVKNSDLRLQCEHTVKNILMRYRKFYALNPKNTLLAKSFVPAIKDVIAVLKSILRLKNIPVPQNSAELLELAFRIGVEGIDVFGKLLSFKEKKCKIVNVRSTANDFLNALTKLLKYTNDMEN